MSVRDFKKSFWSDPGKKAACLAFKYLSYLTQTQEVKMSIKDYRRFKSSFLQFEV